MMMSYYRIRRWTLFLLIVQVVVNETTRYSHAWTSLRQSHTEKKLRVRMSMDFPTGESQKDSISVCNRRTVLNQAKLFGALIVGGAMAAAVHPSVCQADENGDPFAAMDAAISVGLSSSTFNDVSKNNNDSNVKEATTQSPSSNNIPGSPATSDFENALQESKRRKSIDPLTHG